MSLPKPPACARQRLATTPTILGGLAFLALLAAPSEGWASDAPEPLRPLQNRLARISGQIYDAGAYLAAIPYRWVAPMIAKARIAAWLDGLPLETGVRERIGSRLDSRGELDQVVPFLLAVKEHYSPAGLEDGQESFDIALRKAFTAKLPIPGMEHSMFQFEARDSDQAESTSDASPLRLDAETTAKLLTLYDALYLDADQSSRKNADDPLEIVASCKRSSDQEALLRAVARIEEPTRVLLAEMREKYQVEGEAAAAVNAVLRDDQQLRTLTASAVEFLDRLVCSGYQRLALRVSREQQLRSWLLTEFAKPDGGKIWHFLEDAQSQRRFAMLIVVDGLQGNLVESLATAKSGSQPNVFLQRIAAEQKVGDTHRTAVQPPAARPPLQQTEFLMHVAAHGYSHPAYLPFFRDLFEDQGSADLRRPIGVAVGGVATTPTISVRNIPIALTGATVAGDNGTGLPNFHFVDRSAAGKERPYYFFGNDALRLDELAHAAGMRTLPWRLQQSRGDLSSMSCAAPYEAGSLYAIDALLNLALGEKYRDFAEQRCLLELNQRAKNERKLRSLRDHILSRRSAATRRVKPLNLLAAARKDDERALLIDQLEELAHLEQQTTPELLLYYNPWPDHFAHFTGPFADEIISPSGELNRLDFWLGKLTETYREAGVGDRTIFAMAGDHGMTPVFEFQDPEEQVFAALKREGVEFRVLKISSDEGEGPKLNDRFQPPSAKGFDVVVASTAGGNYMLDFFADQSAAWHRQPLVDELRSLRLIDPSQRRVDIIEELATRLADSLDYLVVRQTPCNESGGQVRVIGTPQSQRLELLITRHGDRILLESEDPQSVELLNLRELSPYRDWSQPEREDHGRLLQQCLEQARRGDPQSWCDEATWGRLASFTKRPDSVVQLAHIYDSERAGTVNLFPRDGVAYNSTVPGRHAGESFHEKDAFVGFWGAPVKGPATRERAAGVVNGSLAPTVFEYLNGQPLTADSRSDFAFPSLGSRLFPDSLRRSQADGVVAP